MSIYIAKRIEYLNKDLSFYKEITKAWEGWLEKLKNISKYVFSINSLHFFSLTPEELNIFSVASGSIQNYNRVALPPKKGDWFSRMFFLESPHKQNTTSEKAKHTKIDSKYCKSMVK